MNQAHLAFLDHLVLRAKEDPQDLQENQGNLEKPGVQERRVKGDQPVSRAHREKGVREALLVQQGQMGVPAQLVLQDLLVLRVNVDQLEKLVNVESKVNGVQLESLADPGKVDPEDHLVRPEDPARMVPLDLQDLRENEDLVVKQAVLGLMDNLDDQVSVHL